MNLFLATSEGFHFNWPIKLSQLDTGIKHSQVDTYEISTKLDDRFDNSISSAATVPMF